MAKTIEEMSKIRSMIWSAQYVLSVMVDKQRFPVPELSDTIIDLNNAERHIKQVISKINTK